MLSAAEFIGFFGSGSEIVDDCDGLSIRFDRMQRISYVLKGGNDRQAVLRSRLLDKAQAEVDAESSALRKSQVGSGDRSEKIRTYNFPQSRVTDHRVNVTIHSLETFMQGQLEAIIEPLRAAHEAERLKQLS